MSIDGQSCDLFDVLVRPNIEGLPSHIMNMSIHLDISRGSCPFVILERAITDQEGNIQINSEYRGEILREAERYSLEIFGGKITAKKVQS